MERKMTKEEVREGYVNHLKEKTRQNKVDADNYTFNKSIKLNKRIGKW